MTATGYDVHGLTVVVDSADPRVVAAVHRRLRHFPPPGGTGGTEGTGGRTLAHAQDQPLLSHPLLTLVLAEAWSSSPPTPPRAPLPCWASPTRSMPPRRPAPCSPTCSLQLRLLRPRPPRATDFADLAVRLAALASR